MTAGLTTWAVNGDAANRHTWRLEIQTGLDERFPAWRHSKPWCLVRCGLSRWATYGTQAIVATKVAAKAVVSYYAMIEDHRQTDAAEFVCRYIDSLMTPGMARPAV